VIVVVMGVSGVGKFTVAEGLASLLGWSLRRGDAFHPEAHHYMPASLLPSQLATLEPLEPDEPGVELSADGTTSL
jgi:gluconate kinase